MHMNGFFVRWTMVVWKNPDDSSTLWKEGCIRKNETALVIMLHLLKITSFLAWALHFETEPRLLLPISYMAHSHRAAFFCWIRYALQEKCIVCRFYRGILHFCGVTLSFSRSTAQFNKNMNAYECYICCLLRCSIAFDLSFHSFQFRSCCASSRNVWNVVCLL